MPENVLNSWLFKLNFHAAPASYPGRDLTIGQPTIKLPAMVQLCTI